MRNVRNSAGKIDVIRGVRALRPLLQRWALGVGRSAFTLIELMVVIAVIGILIAGVFRLLSAAGTGNKRAETIARLERVQNALSGFYAEFGTYPPVPQHCSPDPYVKEEENGSTSPAGTLTEANATRAASCQPVAFCYPNVRSLDKYIALRWGDSGVYSVNDALGPNAANRTESEWSGIRIFQFGLMSYLMPRVELMGGEELAKVTPDTAMTPDLNFFSSRQWQKHNAGALAAQRARENHAVARWLPNFEKSLVGGPSDLMGINTCEPETGISFVQQSDPGNTGVKYMLQQVTVRDGWGRELYYHSMPPYQSYRIWSAGPDGKTFPPWISLEGLKADDREKVTSWTKDDVARFDRSK